MLATNLSEAETPDEKLRMAFKMYDKDGSGARQNFHGIDLYQTVKFGVREPLLYQKVLFLTRKSSTV